MTNATDALRALDPSYWEVEVRVSGESVLTIGSDHLAGISNIADYADTVRKCGEHLLSFVGDGMCYCQEGVTCPTCERSEVAALQDEVARLRELATMIVEGAMPATTSGATCFVPRYQIDRLLAAMGSANGQG